MIAMIKVPEARSRARRASGGHLEDIWRTSGEKERQASRCGTWNNCEPERERESMRALCDESWHEVKRRRYSKE